MFPSPCWAAAPGWDPVPSSQPQAPASAGASSCDVGWYQHPLRPALRLLPAQCAQTPGSRAQAGCDSAGLGELQPRQDPGPRASPASTAAAAAHPCCPSQFAPRRHSKRASSQGRCRTGASCSQPSRSHFCDSAPVTATRPLPHPTSRPLPPPRHCDAAAEPPMAGPSSRTWSSPARSPLTRRMRAAAAWALGKHAPACARGDKLPHATLSNRQSGA